MVVIQPNGTTTTCQPTSHKYPLDINSASGVLVGNTMVICGGRFDRFVRAKHIKYYDDCFSFGEDNQWRNLSRMSTRRDDSAAISVTNGIWITGGVDSNNEVLDSTEFIFLNGTRADGPQLPKARYGHCIVQYR